ncbi:CBS domain-containing protein [Halodesulfurarchaeum sp. HSR-GB]|uniref:CBS domain-containing protein n=1 Tax=Halodesulfurarchaeum sp. HSR-GB TaxID=3074077 RepID=UPI0028548551|nr:CBS domain-containing protein [Halodesulfurarchaeum sp. HSR-GB]MDR5655692.1 CBS domain-containing protein [Halodesulfurarchaeum sp. HSR-GB]
MQARELMTADVETVQHDDSVGEVLKKMSQRPFNGFPVVDDDGRLVGIVTQRDLVDIFEPSDRTFWIPVGLPPFLEPVDYAIEASFGDLDLEIDLARHAGDPISTVMTEDVVTVGPAEDIETVIEILARPEPNVNRVPVVQDGFVEGIITRQDVLSYLHRTGGLGGESEP